MELIDRDALLKKCIEGDGNDKFTEGYNFAVQEISAYITLAPTIEAEPVRHGRWLSYTGTHYTGKENEYGDPEYKEHIFFVCSNCRRKTVVREHFCPKCGSKNEGD